MSHPNTSLAVVLSSPIKGIYQKDPLAAMDPQSATWLLNLDCENQYLKLRPGTVINATIATAGTALTLALGVNGIGTSQKLFAYVYPQGGANNFVYDVSTATPALVFTCADSAAREVAWVQYAGYGSFVHNSGATSSFPTVLGTGAFANGWVETSAGNKVLIGPACWYRGRIYTCPNNLTPVYWGDVGQVSGVLTHMFNVDQIYTTSQKTVLLATFSQSDGIVNTDYIVFGNDLGELLVYGGDYPDSTTWKLTAKLRISRPVGWRYSKTIAFENDTLIITRNGLISVRTLFTQGNTAGISQSISFNIDDYWSALFAQLPESTGLTNGDVCGIWAQKKSKIYILVQGHIDENGAYSTSLIANTLLVMNTNTGAWSIYKIPAFGSVVEQVPGNLVIFQDEVYYACNNRIMKFSDTTYTDIDTNNASSLSSIPLACYGSPQAYVDKTNIKKVSGYTPIVNQDLPQMTLKVVADFGVKTTAAVTYGASGAGFIPLPAGYSKPFCSVGIDGTFFQFKLNGETKVSGTTTTQGFGFYSINTLLEEGGIL